MAADKIQSVSSLTTQPEPQLLPLAGGRVFIQNQMLQPQYFSYFPPNKYWNQIFRLPGVAEGIHFLVDYIITIFLLY